MVRLLIQYLAIYINENLPNKVQIQILKISQKITKYV